MTVQSAPTITIWPATARGQPDSVTHFWYIASDSQVQRICDGRGWPTDQPLVTSTPDVYVPCTDCRWLYVDDMVQGDQRLSLASHIASPLPSAVYSPQYGEYPTKGAVYQVDIGNVAVASFARFSEASMAQRVRVVRDARLYRSDPDGYGGRDYYFDLRNTLRKTHWQEGGRIDAFQAAVEPMLSRQKVKGRADHYKVISAAYIDFWKRRDAEFFRIPPATIDLAGLAINVSAEVGMRYDGNTLALKIVWTAPKPTRHFRQVIQFLSDEAFENRAIQPAIWDVRRGEILPRVPTPRDFRLALEGDAMAFQQIWQGLDRDSDPFGF